MLKWNDMKEQVSLKPYNTFCIDVSARYFADIHSVSELQTILTDTRTKNLSKLILGGGSNILLTKNIDGLVIHNCIRGIEKISEDEKNIYLKIGGGEIWHELVLHCIQHHYAGIENLSLIPGTVGAAPIQNIGAYGVELKDVLHEVHALDFSDNKFRVFNLDDCKLGYRDSIFKNKLKNKCMITHVVLRLNKTPTFHVEYGAIREKLNESPLSIKTISDAIIEIRQSKLPDPIALPNAGSFFKNPLITLAQFSELKIKFPTMPHFSEKKSHVKIPAAWLIEQCGFRGKKIGSVGVHENHALVLVNHGGSGAQMLSLANTIIESVRDRFDIVLMPEVNVY